MIPGLGYGSDAGRAYAGAITALMTAVSYKVSAEMAGQLKAPERAIFNIHVPPYGIGLDEAPMLDADASAQLGELVAKGAGGTLFLETDDCQLAYDQLSARGVVFNDPPTAQPYGIDTSFRDPSGNNIRLTQVLEFSPDRR